MSVSFRITSLLIVSLFALALILGGLTDYFINENSSYFSKTYEENLTEAKKQELKSEMTIVKKMIEKSYQNLKQEGFSDEDIKESIFYQLKDLRFFEDSSGYVFIFDLNGKSLLHPENPSLHGVNMIEAKDSNNLYFIKELIQSAKSGGGHVLYHFPKTKGGEPLPKISYSLLFEPYGWMMGTGVYIDNIDKEKELINLAINSSTKKNLTLFGAISFFIVLLTLIISFLIVKLKITNPLNSLILRAENLSSKDGDLTQRLEVIGKDELAKTSSAINNFIEKVHSVISEVKALSSENSTVSHELSSSSLESGKRAENTTEIVLVSTKKAHLIQEKMSGSIKEALEGKEDLQKANELISIANDSISNLAKEIENSAAIESNLALEIEELNKEAQQAREILEMIEDIADQTNLLALNAAIEAARAGEHGRGFAVVADEVRNLAERTQRSLTEINATINVIVQSISSSSEQMSSNSKRINEINSVALGVKSQILQMSQSVKNAVLLSDKTMDSYAKNGKEIEQMIKSISQINTLSTENARSAQEIASASEHLSNMTELLNEKLAEFKT
ncbi:MAG: cache domain-containing protein [Sulfurospirillaceae bacterium]